MDDSVGEETAMKSKKTTKRLHKSKKLEATKPLSTAATGKVTLKDIPVTKWIDKPST